MKNTDQSHNEIERFVKSFSESEASPSVEFEADLKNKLFQELNSDRKFNFNKLFKMSRKTVSLTLGVILTLIVVVGVGGYFSYPYLKSEYVKRNTNLDDILANVVKNNSLNGVNSASRDSNSLYAAAESAADEDAAAGGLKIMAPYSYQGDTDSNYSYTSTSLTYGPARNKCEALVNYGYGVNAGKILSYSYWDEEGSKYKYVVFDEKENLVSYSLDLGNMNYDYRGGKYAFLVKYPEVREQVLEVVGEDSAWIDPSTEIPDNAKKVTGIKPTTSEDGGVIGTDQSVPIEGDVEPPVGESTEPAPDVDYNGGDTPSDEPTTDSGSDFISQYFGSDAKLLGVENIDGKEHYVISWSYESPCDLDALISYSVSSDARDGTTQLPEGVQKIVMKAYVEEETYKISKEESYFGSLAAANLIVSSETESFVGKVDLSTVKDQFVFDYDVPVQEFQYADWDAKEEAANTKNYLAKNPLTLIFTDQNGWKNNSVYVDGMYSENTPPEYYYDRNFYPSGSRGNTLYEAATKYKDEASIDSYLQPDASTSAGTTGSEYEFLSVAVYKKDVSNSELLSSNGYVDDDYTDIASSKVTITLSGKSVSADRYDIDYKNDAITLEEKARASEGSSGGGSTGNQGSADTPPSDGVESKTTVYIFKYNGLKYLLYHGAPEGKSLPTLKAYDAALSSELKAIGAILDSLAANL